MTKKGTGVFSGCRVVKLGGSLLDWPQWPGAFRDWLAVQPAAENVMIVGGGAMVEELRRLDRLHALPAETTHWLAIRLMDLNAALVAQLLDGSDSLRFLPVESWLKAEPSAEALPCTWDVTSDTIAAHAAHRLGADELVLLKSSLPDGRLSLIQLAERGYVDAEFAARAAGIEVRMVNLRDPAFGELRIPADGSGAGADAPASGAEA